MPWLHPQRNLQTAMSFWAGTLRAVAMCVRIGSFDLTVANFFSLGTGGENGVSDAVRSVFADGDKIYVGGHFSRAGSVVANNIAMFENGQWRSIGEGANNGVSGFVCAIQTFSGQLLIGGYSGIVSKLH